MCMLYHAGRLSHHTFACLVRSVAAAWWTFWQAHIEINNVNQQPGHFDTTVTFDLLIEIQHPVKYDLFIGVELLIVFVISEMGIPDWRWEFRKIILSMPDHPQINDTNRSDLICCEMCWVCDLKQSVGALCVWVPHTFSGGMFAHNLNSHAAAQYVHTRMQMHTYLNIWDYFSRCALVVSCAI